ncbi:hypothetical protein OIO90_002693 [Microbotryomycetes sp. JL221]|nr:hypothetical protein OIO90_002693 [Microbotryomycetes sp. JL221]
MQPTTTSSPVSPYHSQHFPQSMFQQPMFGQQQTSSSTSWASQQHQTSLSSGTVTTGHGSIPFSTPPGPAPGSMGFGFGLSAANRLNVNVTTSHGWPAPLSSPRAPTQAVPMMQTGSGHFMTSHHHQQQQQRHHHHNDELAMSPSRSLASTTRRRRRSASATDDDEQDIRSPATRVVRGLHKKPRTNPVTANDERVTAVGNQVDLGKALASLSKESLLSLVNNLITTQPQLRATVQALLPRPTLTDTLATVATLERNIINALPAGQFLREEYVWGRVRLPLEEYISEAKTFLSAFISAATSTVDQSNPAVVTVEEDITHPSTTFAFLFALTCSIKRLELGLPQSTTALNPLSNHLLPLTVNCWHIFLTKLSTSVNEQGRMISAGMLRGWFNKLEELTTTEQAGPGAVKKACQGVRDRMKKEVGWLVGIKDVSCMMAESSMDDDEEL